MYYASLRTPVGLLWLSADEKGLRSVGWHPPQTSLESPDHPILEEAIAQLKEYFAGSRRDFDLPLAPEGTDFQLKAWSELTRIPYGETISYAEQAKRLGNAKALRAVGMANGKNPLAIVVPCHRVIEASGKIGGFGGGVEAKRTLLSLESPQSALL